MGINFNNNIHINLDENSDSSFNPMDNDSLYPFPTPNFPLHPITSPQPQDTSNNIYLLETKKDNEEKSIIIKNNNSEEINQIESFKGEKEKNESNNNNLENSHECKDKEISNNNHKKVLFYVNDTISTGSQTKKKNQDNKEAESDNSEEKKSDEKKQAKTHNKYSDDNIRRKCKRIVLKYVMEFINKKLISIYQNNLGNGIKTKQLKQINKEQVSKSNIDFNQNFLNKTLKEIFSDSISTKYKNFPQENNKTLIQDLINEHDEGKRIYFNKLFDLTFLECLEHFINKKQIDELKGLMLYEEMKISQEELNNVDIAAGDDDYLATLDYNFINYEKILVNKKARKVTKKTTKKTNKKRYKEDKKD